MKRKKQNKHLDPMFRKKIRSLSGNKHRRESWISYCKRKNIKIPEYGKEDLKNI